MDNHAYHPDESNEKPFAITRYPSIDRSPNYLVEVNSRSKFFKRPRFYHLLIAVLLTLLLILLIVLLILIFIYCKDRIERQLCTEEECLRSAANLRLSMDLSVNPCEDFYQYTCGRWSQEHPNHGWFASFSTFSTISEKVLIETENFLTSPQKDDDPIPVKQARDFYISCMDSDASDELGFSVIYKYLKEVNLPAIPNLFTKTDAELANFTFDWLKTEALIKKIFSADVFIGFFVDPNYFNRSINAMYIGVPEQRTPLPAPFRRQNSDQSDDPSEQYEKLRRDANSRITEYVIKALILNQTSQMPKQDVLDQAVDVLLNMTQFVDELIENNTNWNEYPLPDPFQIKTYQTRVNQGLTNTTNKNYPKILEKYIGYLFDGTNITVDFDKDVLYMGESGIEYVPKILSYVLTSSDIYLELYMWWVTVYAMIINTTTEVILYIQKQAEPFYTGSPVIRSRSLGCCSLITNFMGMAVSYGVADRTFSNKTKPKVEQMLFGIKNAFIEHVNTLSWMDKDTKQATLEKSREMISFIGYPDWLFEKGALETYYKGVEVRNDTYLENMMSVIKIYFPSRLEQLREANERNWTTDPTVVNAFNSFPDNAINVPMAILAFPVYNLGLEVLNYGAIGTVLGHELTHGFDNTGRKHDKYGNYKQWWTNETIKTFDDKIQCFIQQYDNFTVDGIEKHVQGEKTLGENLADNGGLGHAFKAYQNYKRKFGPEPHLPGFENFTSEQMFFIAFGSIWCETIELDDLLSQIEFDEHAPHRVRVVASLQNSPDFAKTFKCPAGSHMNPKRTKCKVW